MSMSEKFCLKWNDFQENISTAFDTLRKDRDFTDVTLACEDGHQIEAHKVILAASSPFFDKLLKRNKHGHPLIYMRGLKSEDLIAIVDFLYYGEANIYQENLDAFLTIAEELNLKGLNGGDKVESGNFTKSPNETFYQEPVPQLSKNHTPMDPANFNIFEFGFKKKISTERTIAVPKQQFSGEMQELAEQIELMMEKGNNTVSAGPNTSVRATICKICGKEGKRIDIKRHIEVHHLEGISIPCNSCEKTFRSRKNLQVHTIKYHK